MTKKAPLSIMWTNKTVKVADLESYERNPRRISKEAFEKLKASLQANGYYQPIIAQPSLLVIGGHQRIRALKELGVEEVTVRVPDHELTQEEFRRILVTDNLPFGEFDFEMLATDFETTELLDWGMPEDWFKNLEKNTNEKELDSSSQLEGLKFSVIVDCENEDDQITTLQILAEQGYKTKALIS